MVSGLSAVIIILCQILRTLSVPTHLSEDKSLYLTELLSKYGLKRYDVITEDGYALLLHRLPGTGRRKIPVLFVHGMFCSADTWVLRGNASLPVTLANAGYDVWLGNCRGNRYSRRHLSLDPDSDNAFWNFSFHEQAIYDLTAIIDTVLEKSGAKNINAIAHSLGNTLFYVLGSTKPEYNQKINLLTALSPVSFLHNTPAPIKTILNISPLFGEIGVQFHMWEIMGSGLYKNLLNFFCALPIFAYKLCIENILFSLTGADSDEIGPDFLPLIANHFPTSSSLKTVLHLGQIYINENFAPYDYGLQKNRLMYNSSKPLVYDLDKDKMPVALVSAKNDRISTLSDVNILRSKLANVVSDLIIPMEKFNHVDYIWGEHTNMYLHPYILSILEKYS